MDGDRQADSSYFFSDRRLSQLFNVDAWTTEGEVDVLDDDHLRDPPPEPAPRGSYCPPSPGTAHASTQLSLPQAPTLPFSSFSPHYHHNKLPAITGQFEALPPSFSDDMAINMSRLSKISVGSNLTAERDDINRSSLRYSRNSSIGDTATRYNIDSVDYSNKDHSMSPQIGIPGSRLSQLSQLTVGSSDRNSRASSSLPSVLSELAGEDRSNNDHFSISGNRSWSDAGNNAEDSDIDWQDRCYELEMSLQNFRDKAGRIRDVLRDKLSEMEKKVILAEGRAKQAEDKIRIMEKKFEGDDKNGLSACVEEVTSSPKLKGGDKGLTEELVSTLSSQIEEQRLLRMEDAKKVEAKASKIKHWVTSKLKELEDQNSLLRVENARCNIQLEMLRERLDQLTSVHNGKSKENENDSTRGSLEAENQPSLTNEQLNDSFRINNRFIPNRPSTLGRDSKSKSRSPFNLRRANSGDLNGCHMNNASERAAHELFATNDLSGQRSSRESKGDSGSIDLETYSLSPRSPLEVMLENLTRNTGVGGSLPRQMSSTLPSGNPGLTQIGTKGERTSNRFSQSVDQIDFSEKKNNVELEGRISKAKDELHDYSEIYTPSQEFVPWGGNTGHPDKPPTPPLHRFPSWESRIYQVAQKGLSMSDLGKDDKSQRHTTGLGSYSEIHVPVYAAVKGRASQIRSMPFTGDSSDSSDGEDHSGGSMPPAIGRPISTNPSSSSNNSTISSPTRSKTYSLSPAKHSSLSPTKSVKRDMSFESGMSDDYAIPPDARSDTVSVLSAMSNQGPTVPASLRTSSNEVTVNTVTNSSFAAVVSPQCVGLTSPRYETSLEKSGYLTKLGGKLKTWKRRYFVLKDGALTYWKSQNDVTRCAAGEITLDHGSTVSRSEGAHTFELNTAKKVYYLTADNTVLVEEWVRVIQNVLRRNATRLLLSREDTKPTLQGWLTKVKHGHAKRCWCVLLGKVFIYFKNPSDQTPLGQINMRDTRVEDVSKMSDSEGEEQEMEQVHQEEFTISLFPSHQGPTYLICSSKQEKDSWLYHLTIVSGGGLNVGTQYEQLIQKLMELDGDSNCVLWHHPLLLHSKEPSTTSFTTLPTQQLQYEALKLFKSCQLYTSVLMEPSAIDYHVVLCQNALHLCLTHPELQPELFCGLVKQTSAHTHAKTSAQVTKTLNKIKNSRNLLVCATQSLFLCDSSGAHKSTSPVSLSGQGITIDHKINPPSFTFVQGWQFLALAVSLFVPKNNKLLWYLKLHLQRYSDPKSEIGKYATYCSRALQRTVDNGAREAKPSRMEVLSVLLKNPYHHSLPHAIPVHFLNGTYQVVGFDGSTSVEEFLVSLNHEIGCRDVHQSGFALFSDDPIEKNLEHCLNHNAKLCDVISKWETALREKGLGKFENTKVIRLLYKNRLSWKYAAKHETEKEKLLLCHQVNEQIQEGKFPVTKELALELTTLMAQIDMPEATIERPRGSGSSGPSSVQLNQAFTKFYPQKYKEELTDIEKRALIDSLQEKWLGLRGRTQSDCVRIFLTCARKWPFFGANLFPASTVYPKFSSDSLHKSDSSSTATPVWVAVTEEAVILLDKSSMQPLVKYPYGNVVTFGGCQEDFMLVVHTPENETNLVTPMSTPLSNPGTHKLLLSMSKPKILELTLLIADYMNALGRGIPGTPQAGTLTRTCSHRSTRATGSTPGGQPDLLQMTNDVDKKDHRKKLNTDPSPIS